MLEVLGIEGRHWTTNTVGFPGRSRQCIPIRTPRAPYSPESLAPLPPPPPPSLPREKNRRASNGVGDRGIRPHRRQPPRLRCPIPGSGTSPRLSLLLPLLVHPLSSYSLPSLLRLAPRSRETEERPGRPPPPLVGDASPPSTSPIAPQVNLRRFPTLRCPHLLFFLLWFGRLAP